MIKIFGNGFRGTIFSYKSEGEPGFAFVQVQQLASKDTDRSWVGFKDSTGHKRTE